MSIFDKIKSFFSPSSYKLVRARTKKGQFIADDPTTKKNEAYKKIKLKKSKK